MVKLDFTKTNIQVTIAQVIINYFKCTHRNRTFHRLNFDHTNERIYLVENTSIIILELFNVNRDVALHPAAIWFL